MQAYKRPLLWSIDHTAELQEGTCKTKGEVNWTNNILRTTLQGWNYFSCITSSCGYNPIILFVITNFRTLLIEGALTTAYENYRKQFCMQLLTLLIQNLNGILEEVVYFSFRIMRHIITFTIANSSGTWFPKGRPMLCLS